ncbi:hypothetical protein Hanom_Chr15g01374041 [Helianthus anomalus]
MGGREPNFLIKRVIHVYLNTAGLLKWLDMKNEMSQKEVKKSTLPERKHRYGCYARTVQANNYKGAPQYAN